MVRDDFDIGIEEQGTLPGHLRLALTHVLLVEQELPVEIADVDGVQIDLGMERGGRKWSAKRRANTKCFFLRFRCV